MPYVKADLHIHSCLSPCGSLDNSPTQIVKKAKECGLQMIALSDHNSGENLPAFFVVAKEHNIIPIAGIEITTQEETHLLTLFPSLAEALAVSDKLYQLLPSIKNDPEKLGDQVVVDENENIIDEKEKYLNQATSLNIKATINLVHEHNGLVIAAHIDRFTYSIPAVLGFLPDLPFDGVESYSMPCPIEHKNYKVITNSDAHFIDDIGKRFNQLDLESPDFEGLRQWFLKGQTR